MNSPVKLATQSTQDKDGQNINTTQYVLDTNMHILNTNYLYFHRYFHVNFGFNSYFFDWFHDTLRKDDREYGEDIFGGKGKQPIETKKSS